MPGKHLLSITIWIPTLTSQVLVISPRNLQNHDKERMMCKGQREVNFFFASTDKPPNAMKKKKEACVTWR